MAGPPEPAAVGVEPAEEGVDAGSGASSSGDSVEGGRAAGVGAGAGGLWTESKAAAGYQYASGLKGAEMLEFLEKALDELGAGAFGRS